MPRNVTDVRLQVGSQFIKNNSFEVVPPFTAATTSANVWIDGTATGSTTGDSYGWCIYFKQGTSSAQFDTTTFYSGAASLKLSTQAINSQVVCAPWPTNTQNNIGRYLIKAEPSTAYTVTYMMKTNLTSGAANGGCYLRARTWQNAGTVIATTLGSSVKTTVDWTKYTINLTTSALTQYISLEPAIIGSDGAATLIIDAWFDDLKLVKNNASRTSSI